MVVRPSVLPSSVSDYFLLPTSESLEALPVYKSYALNATGRNTIASVKYVLPLFFLRASAGGKLKSNYFYFSCNDSFDCILLFFYKKSF